MAHEINYDAVQPTFQQVARGIALNLLARCGYKGEEKEYYERRNAFEKDAYHLQETDFHRREIPQDQAQPQRTYKDEKNFDRREGYKLRRRRFAN